MNHRHLLALALPLAVALPLSAAEWSSQARSEFIQECINGAPAGYEQPQLEAYCDCAAEQVSGEFSESEIQSLSHQSPADAALQERMTKVTGTCSSRIKPNPD